MKAPDLTSKIIGYRCWQPSMQRVGLKKHYTLHSPIVNRRPWHPGINKAKCLVDEWNPFGLFFNQINDEKYGKDWHQEVPEKNCKCGLYACHTPWDAIAEGADYLYPHVLGAVAAWGKIELYETGFRAEYAEPIALIIPDALEDPDFHDPFKRSVWKWEPHIVSLSQLYPNRALKEITDQYKIELIKYETLEDLTERLSKYGQPVDTEAFFGGKYE